MRRRQFIFATLAIPVLTAPVLMAAQKETPLRVVLLGQALLQHDLSPAQWPDGAVFAKLFAGADACFSDLETAIQGPHAEAPKRTGEFFHAADAGVIDCLAKAGLTLFATSNNHAFDFGAGGIRDAIEALDARGLAHAGTGLDLAHAAAPGYRQSPRGMVALVAMASGAVPKGGMATADQPGVNEVRREVSGALNEDDVARYIGVIGTAAATADVVIAYQHNHYWEKNMADTPAWQRTLAHRAIDAGATIFVSHGAPLLHGIEIYKGRPIFFDLGGFFFQTVTKPGTYPPEVWESVAVDCQCGKVGAARITLRPVQLNDTGTGGADDMVTRGMPRLAQGADAARILERLARISAPYGTKFKIAGDTAEIVLT